MSTPTHPRRGGSPCGGPVGRRPTRRQLREAASQLAEEGQLLWLVGQGLDIALTAAEAPWHVGGVVDALREWAGRAIGAAAAVREGAALAPRWTGDVRTHASPLHGPSQSRRSHPDQSGEKAGASAGIPVAWVASQTARGSWVTLAVGVDRHGRKMPLSLHEGSTSDPVVARKVVRDMVGHVDPLAGLLLITDGSRTLDDVVTGEWDGGVQLAHCHLKLRDDLLAHVGKDGRARLAEALALAWQQPPNAAATSLRSLVSSLRKRHPTAAERLERSLEASLRVAGLGVGPPLRDHLESTGVVRMAIEKALRWGRSTAGGAAAVAAGLPTWQQRTRRLIGFRGLAALAQALQECAPSAS